MLCIKICFFCCMLPLITSNHTEKFNNRRLRFAERIELEDTTKSNEDNKHKKHLLQNSQHVWWKGKMHVIPPAIKPEKIHTINANMKHLLNGKSCNVRPIKSPFQKNKGPKEDNFSSMDFLPCLERKRGGIITADDRSTTEEMEAGEEETSEGTANERQINKKSRRKRSESFATTMWLWEDPENIPFMFDSSFEEEYKLIVKKAKALWESSTCLKFVEVITPPENNKSYVLLTRDGNSCTTDHLGPKRYSPYKTVVDASLCSNEAGLGPLVHEFGHVIGLTHSQNRLDRDDYLRIYLDNIMPDWVQQYNKDDPTYFSSWGVPFYYDSIMLYGAYAAANTDQQMTACPGDPLAESVMGQRVEPAFGDISLVNKMYCQESFFKRDDLPLPFLDNVSLTISGRTCQYWSSQSPHEHEYDYLGDHNYCRNPDKLNLGPWCYTTDPLVLYEPCFNACEDLAASGRKYCEGWCYNGGYHSPDNCSCICPPYTTGTYCQRLQETKRHGYLRCGGKIDLVSIGSKSTFTSPNYPDNYSDYIQCMWFIQAPEATKILLTFNDFEMESSDNTGCYDFLEIRPSKCAAATIVPDKLRFCGDALAPDAHGSPYERLSDDNNYVIKMVTDKTDSARGFNATVTCISTEMDDWIIC